MLSPDDLELTQVAARLGTRLRATGRRLVTAESCTGGWIAKTCTDLSGSSSWFECGFVTYSNEAKMRDLGVGAEILEAHGAVSEATVMAMARGAASRSHSDVGIAVSGVAGPDGGTAEKPVGTVWLAVAVGRNDGGGSIVGGAFECVARCHRFSGNRDDVRRASTLAALRLAIEFIQ